MLTNAQLAAAESAIDGLRSAFWSAWATVASSSVFFNGQLRSTVLANLEVDRAKIDDLETRWLDLVRSGQRTFAQWSTVAEAIHDDIQYQANTTDEWAFSGVLASAAGATAGQVAAGAQDAVKSVGGGFGAGAIVGLLLVLWLAK